MSLKWNEASSIGNRTDTTGVYELIPVWSGKRRLGWVVEKNGVSLGMFTDLRASYDRAEEDASPPKEQSVS